MQPKRQEDKVPYIRERTGFFRSIGLHHILLQNILPASLLFNRELCTTVDLPKPPTAKDIVQSGQRKQIMHRDSHSRDRVFVPGDTVLKRNYLSKTKWVPATLITRTGPGSYTVQAADGVWCHHVDQLLNTTAPGVSVEDTADTFVS